MKYLKKIANFIKNNKAYCIVMVLGLIGLAIQNKYVVLYADDLSLGKISYEEGFLGAIRLLADNYMNWGGGPTPFLAVIVLIFGINFWKILSCIVMFIMIALSVEMITYNKKINKGIIASILWSLMYVLNIFIAKETLYWLDGHLAYVFTSFQLLIYFYYLYSRLIMNKPKRKYDLVLLPIFAFFSGWTGPQTAALTVFIGILIIGWKKIILKEKIEKIYVVTFIFSVIGCLVEVLAPGNSVRMKSGSPEFAQYNIIEKIAYRVDSVFGLIFDFKTYGFASIPFYIDVVLGIMALIAYKYAIKEEKRIVKNLMKTCSIILLIFLSAMLMISLNNIIHIDQLDNLINYKNLLHEFENRTYNNTMLIPYVIGTFILFLGCILSIYISSKQKTPILEITIISAVIGQAIMCVAPYSPLRTTFITILLLCISIAYLILVAHEEETKINYIIIIALMISAMKLGMFALIVYFVFGKLHENNKIKNKEIILTTSILVILALLNWNVVRYNYKINKEIYNENINRLERFASENHEEGTLKLLKPAEPLYGCSEFIGIDWIERTVKDYFNINQNVQLVEEK